MRRVIAFAVLLMGCESVDATEVASASTMPIQGAKDERAVSGACLSEALGAHRRSYYVWRSHRCYAELFYDLPDCVGFPAAPEQTYAHAEQIMQAAVPGATAQAAELVLLEPRPPGASALFRQMVVVLNDDQYVWLWVPTRARIAQGYPAELLISVRLNIDADNKDACGEGLPGRMGPVTQTVLFDWFEASLLDPLTKLCPSSLTLVDAP